MTLIVRCEDKHRLVSCLYGECSPEEEAAVQSHLATCGECASEFAGLRQVRGHLSGWQAPDADLGFTVTRSAAPLVPAVPERRPWAVPVWAQAAAAVLVLSAGAAIANLEIRYGADGFTVRTGWQQAPPPSSAAAPAAAVAPVQTASVDAGAWKTAIAESEKRLRLEFASNRPTAPQPLVAHAGAGDDELLRQVRLLIEESERRQQRELALRVSQVSQDVDAQRRADLVRIEQNMGQIEGLTGAEAARQREALNYLLRVSQRR